MQSDDIWGALQELQSVNFSEGGLVVVDFLEGDSETIRKATTTVHVREEQVGGEHRGWRTIVF